MQQSTIQQRILLSATVWTLALLVVFAYFQPVQIWPFAILLGSVWGTIGILMIRGVGRGADWNGKK
jgi:hypothetical protein